MFKRSSTLLRGLPDSNKLKEYSKKLKNKESKPDEKEVVEVAEYSDDDEEAPMNTQNRKSNKNISSRLSKASKRSRSVMYSETSEVINSVEKYPRLTKIRNSAWYLGIYYFCYYFLALNDHLRLLILSKDQDSIFLAFTIIFAIVFVVDIISRAFVEDGYFPKFFFMVD
jgi:hypothetical protein